MNQCKHHGWAVTGGSVQCEVCVQRTCHSKCGSLPSSESTILYQLESVPGGSHAEPAPTDPVPTPRGMPGCLQVLPLVLPSETQAQKKVLSSELQGQERQTVPSRGKQGRCWAKLYITSKQRAGGYGSGSIQQHHCRQEGRGSLCCHASPAVPTSLHYLLQLFDAAAGAHFFQVGFKGLDAGSPI